MIKTPPKTLKSVQDFLKHGLIEQDEAQTLERGAGLFQMAMTSAVLDTVRGAAAHDPIHKQYVPSAAEFNFKEDELNDPIGDGAHRVCRGLVHRYPDRVLFKVTQSCAVYCRFCFRRELLGDDDRTLTQEDIDAALDYIAAHKGIHEVILSGGDPFVMSARRLKNLMERFNQMEHIQFIRFHTRVPVVNPKAITSQFCESLKSHKRIIVSIHTNHVQELSPAAKSAIDNLDKAGITLISQTVLLRGVNNNPETLMDLFKGLMQVNVKPAYLHHPDKAKGTSHFRVSIEEGKEIFTRLRGQVSGHCLPDYVLDIPGGFGKVPVTADWVKLQSDGSYIVTDIHGGTHQYKD
ncbi:MAG: lysine-2,3-aminomutase-like protein [Alphaproteobacteria bacterium]|nr:lysine-2,3-aminomutase-like protein [Alphaproteobacteria bacterium]NCQ87563.1 lysine-2,3-aminomutase-like protein [Alphaproteobacteria bacterium]NCT06432.1 lysine-2,3-aminomutase-like protein [Alphaproteobacteria bacterium]